MSSEDAEVYIMRAGDDGEWVNPTPASSAILDAVVDATDVTEDDLEALADYVDLEELRAVLENGEEDISFEIEDAAVTVDADGNIDVE